MGNCCRRVATVAVRWKFAHDTLLASALGQYFGQVGIVAHVHISILAHTFEQFDHLGLVFERQGVLADVDCITIILGVMKGAGKGVKYALAHGCRCLGPLVKKRFPSADVTVDSLLAVVKR